MSEVKRYEINGTFDVPEIGQKLVNPKMVMESDFDRVTAELDAALADVELWRSRCGAKCYEAEQLQQRLTAEDERAVVLEGLLRDALPALDLAADAFKSAKPVRNKVRAALKPTESAKCERCGCSTVETCDDLNCGYLGAGNGAPE